MRSIRCSMSSRSWELHSAQRPVLSIVKAARCPASSRIIRAARCPASSDHKELVAHARSPAFSRSWELHAHELTNHWAMFEINLISGELFGLDYRPQLPCAPNLLFPLLVYIYEHHVDFPLQTWLQSRGGVWLLLCWYVRRSKGKGEVDIIPSPSPFPFYFSPKTRRAAAADGRALSSTMESGWYFFLFWPPLPTDE
jgi:hypothetical protein